MSQQITPISMADIPFDDTVKVTSTYTFLDTTDFSDSNQGTSKQGSIGSLVKFIDNAILVSNILSANVATTVNLNSNYVNGDAGVGATLTNNGGFLPLVIDGVLLAVNDRVLVCQQSLQYENGVYYVSNAGSLTTPWVLTRVSDYDNSSQNQIQTGDFIGITFGTISQRTFYFQVSPAPIVIGVDPIVFQIQNAIPASNELWLPITGVSQSLSSNTGYIINTISLCTLTLPLTCAVGDIIRIQGNSAGLWRVSQNAGQQILWGNVNTTVGAAGYLQSTNAGDAITLLCTVANTQFRASSSQGTINYI